MMKKHYLWLIHCALGALLLMGVDSDENVRIKIVDAPALSRFPSMPSHEQKLTLRVKPANISGPPHLQQLAQTCFSTQQNDYTYTVCPFHNVTQKEDRIAWNSFYGVLGVWSEWIIENDTFTGMLYTVGERCGSVDREAQILFNCSTVTRLHDITEPNTCKYTIWMDTPLACFKGAMQVYHVLTPDQLRRWDQLEEEFYGGEITYQGLVKQRRKLFIESGLLHNPENIRTQLSEPQGNTDADHEELGFANMFGTSPLAECTEEKMMVEKELEELKNTIKEVAKECPEIATRFDFVVKPVAATEDDTNGAKDTIQDEKPEYEQLDTDLDHDALAKQKPPIVNDPPIVHEPPIVNEPPIVHEEPLNDMDSQDRGQAPVEEKDIIDEQLEALLDDEELHELLQEEREL